MAFDIFNYSGTKVTVPVDLESDEIINAVINVYSGDEVLCVEDSKGKIDIYDSAELAGSYRDFTFYDGMTTIKKDGKMDEVGTILLSDCVTRLIGTGKSSCRWQTSK